MVHRAELLHQAHFASYYQYINPPEALSHWVDHYWFLNTYESLGDDVSECHFPRLASEWVFTYAPSHFQGLERFPSSGMAHFVYPCQTLALGVRFQPGVHLPLAQLPEAFQTRLKEDLRHLSREKAPLFFAQQAEHLNQYFSHAVCTQGASSPIRERLHICHQALKAFEHPEHRSVNEVATQLSVTPRTLRRYFQEALLVSPKAAQRQVRLRQALRSRWRSEGLPNAGLLNYYTDTAHFYKTFRQVCQTSLQQFSSRYTG